MQQKYAFGIKKPPAGGLELWFGEDWIYMIS